MATSSILTNFTITGKEAAEDFVDALEATSTQPSRKPTAPIVETLSDPDAIRAFFSRGEGPHERV